MSKGKAQFPCGGNTCNLTGRSKHLARWRKTDANVIPRGGNGLEMGILCKWNGNFRSNLP